MVDWTALGGNPVPGDSDAMRDIAQRFLSISTEACAALDRLEQIQTRAGEGIWTGIGADAFRQQLSEAIPDLRKLAHSHDIAQRALGAYAAGLDDAQAMARTAAGSATDARNGERQASDARERAKHDLDGCAAAAGAATAQLSAAQHALAAAAADDPGRGLLVSHVQDAQSRVRTATAGTDTAQRAVTAAQQAASTAAAQMQAALRLSQQAVGLRQDAGTTVVRQLHEASDAGIANRNIFQKAYDATVDDVRAVVNSPEFAEFLNVLSEVTTVLAVIAMIPGLEELAIVVAIWSVVVFAGRLLQASAGSGTWNDAIWAGIAALPFMRAAKGLRFGVAIEKTVQEQRTFLTIAGEAKRFQFFDDARKATGVWRKVAVADRPGVAEMKRLPVRILGPERYFKINTARKFLTDANNIHHAVNTVLNRPQHEPLTHKVTESVLQTATFGRVH